MKNDSQLTGFLQESVLDTSVVAGDTSDSNEELLSGLYKELRQFAACRLAEERPGQTLQATALVHEAWLRLREDDRQWNDSGHFFCAAAQAMRRILVENARRKQAIKHGGHLKRADIDSLEIAAPLPDDQLLAVDEALDRLAAENARAADVILLRFFAGMTVMEVADQLDISVATVERTWAFGRAWLFDEIQQDKKESRGVRENEPKNRL